MPTRAQRGRVKNGVSCGEVNPREHEKLTDGWMDGSERLAARAVSAAPTERVSVERESALAADRAVVGVAVASWLHVGRHHVDRPGQLRARLVRRRRPVDARETLPAARVTRHPVTCTNTHAHKHK